MPSSNPLISLEDAQGSTLFAGPVVQQGTLPTSGYSSTMNASQVNAAGTAENVALHVGVIIAMALIGVYVLKASGFKFVLAVGS